MDEQSKLEQIGPEYRDQDLLGLNELYHLAMRDQMIAPEGGDSALEIGCGAGLWTRMLCMRYQQVDVVDGSSDRVEAVHTQADGTPSRRRRQGPGGFGRPGAGPRRLSRSTGRWVQPTSRACYELECPLEYNP